MKISGLVLAFWSAVQPFVSASWDPSISTAVSSSVFSCDSPTLCNITALQVDLETEYSERNAERSVWSRVTDWVASKVDSAFAGQYVFPIALFSLNLPLPAWASLFMTQFGPKEKSRPRPISRLLDRQALGHMANLMFVPPGMVNRTLELADASGLLKDQKWQGFRTVMDAFPYFRKLPPQSVYVFAKELRSFSGTSMDETTIECVSSRFGATVEEIEYISIRAMQKRAWIKQLVFVTQATELSDNLVIVVPLKTPFWHLVRIVHYDDLYSTTLTIQEV